MLFLTYGQIIPITYQNITMEDNSILYYTSGYIARAIKKRETYKECCKLLVEDDSVPTINIEDIKAEDIDPVIWESRAAFLKEINRGGLCKPSDAMHTATLHVQEFLTRLCADETLKRKLFCQKNAREVFVRAFIALITTGEQEKSKPLWKIICTKGHVWTKNVKYICRTIFIMGGKNYTSELNGQIHANRKHCS